MFTSTRYDVPCTSPSNLGENFNQSEYAAVGAVFQFAFSSLARGVPSCVASCKPFKHV